MNQSERVLFNYNLAKKTYLKTIIKRFNKDVQEAAKNGKCSITYVKESVNEEFQNLLLSEGYAISEDAFSDIIISW